MKRDGSRRRFLGGVTAAAAVATAGCLWGQADDALGDEGSQSESPTDTASTASATTDGTPTATTETQTSTRTSPTTTDSLDLREANVVGVTVAETGESADGTDYRFDVTLYHDDEGEDGYANWWQVETREGERLGRRELLHAHGTREFTRSATITVPSGVSCVVVRGHDQTHGYGGRAALVSLPAGSVRFVSQESEPASFADAEC